LNMLNATKIFVLLFLISASIFLNSQTSWAKAKEEYAIFDGRMYNSKFYPRIEIIEWTETGQGTTHMEFQNYTKRVPIDLSFELETKQGRNVMLVKYFIPERGEYLCRRVLAPGHFKESKEFYFYKDKSDKDMDVILVSQIPLPDKEGRSEYKPKPYSPCEEPKENKERLPAANERASSNERTEVATPAALEAEKESVLPHDKYRGNKAGGITKKGAAVPFGDL
jgi:hypothetical protein